MTDSIPVKKHTDLYSILDLTEDATLEEITTRYNELLKIYHPDKGGDTKKFIELKLAYKVLSDPEKRQKYAKSLAATFDELKKEYDAPLPYEVATEETVNKFGDKKKEFNDKTMDKVKIKYEKDDVKTFHKILKDKINERDSEINIEKPSEDFIKKFDNNNFNQIFEMYKTSDNTGLQQVEEFYSYSSKTDLAQYGFYDKYDNEVLHNVGDGSSWNDLFNSKEISNVSWEVTDEMKSKNVVDTHCDGEFYKVINERMKEFTKKREDLLYNTTYIISDEHNSCLAMNNINMN